MITSCTSKSHLRCFASIPTSSCARVSVYGLAHVHAHDWLQRHDHGDGRAYEDACDYECVGTSHHECSHACACDRDCVYADDH